MANRETTNPNQPSKPGYKDRDLNKPGQKQQTTNPNQPRRDSIDDDSQERR